MGRKFWIAWAVALLVLLAVYAYGWASFPTRADASAGLLPGRTGFIALPLAIPMVLAARRLSKLPDREAASFYVLPVFLGLGVLLFAMLSGFLPDAVGCVGIGRFGPLPPECMTPNPVRRNALIEAVAVWGVFAALAAAWSTWRRRRAASMATS